MVLWHTVYQDGYSYHSQTQFLYLWVRLTWQTRFGRICKNLVDKVGEYIMYGVLVWTSIPRMYILCGISHRLPRRLNFQE